MRDTTLCPQAMIWATRTRMDGNGVVIVGAGQAAAQLVQSLRRGGYEGDLTLLGDEPYAPYQRPPLSKGYLKGTMEERRLFFRPEDHYANNGITLRRNTRVSRIDRAARTVVTEDGASLPYDRLVLTTGARPRPLPCEGNTLSGVLTMRSLDDAKALQTALDKPSRMVVIGGGYIGLEAAATVSQMGHEVTVLERMPRLLARVTSETIASFYQNLHQAHGVAVRCGVDVAAIEGNTHVTGVRVGAGEVLPADVVLVGIGVLPNQELAVEAGLACDNGILVDDAGRTSDPLIFAAGDCTRRPVPGYGESLRLESVHNALDQADRIAAVLCGNPLPDGEVPWFWSDQYDVKLQTVGLFNTHDSIDVRGDPAGQKFAVLYYQEDRLIAIDAVNDVPSFMAGKKILKRGLPIDRAQAADPAVPLKSLISPYESVAT